MVKCLVLPAHKPHEFCYIQRTMNCFSLLLFTYVLHIFYILFLISALCVCVSIMATDGTSGVQGYTLQNKGEEKNNAHKMGKEPELWGKRGKYLTSRRGLKSLNWIETCGNQARAMKVEKVTVGDGPDWRLIFGVWLLTCNSWLYFHLSSLAGGCEA